MVELEVGGGGHTERGILHHARECGHEVFLVGHVGLHLEIHVWRGGISLGRDGELGVARGHQRGDGVELAEVVAGPRPIDRVYERAVGVGVLVVEPVGRGGKGRGGGAAVAVGREVSQIFQCGDVGAGGGCSLFRAGRCGCRLGVVCVAALLRGDDAGRGGLDETEVGSCSTLSGELLRGKVLGCEVHHAQLLGERCTCHGYARHGLGERRLCVVLRLTHVETHGGSLVAAILVIVFAQILVGARSEEEPAESCEPCEAYTHERRPAGPALQIFLESYHGCCLLFNRCLLVSLLAFPFAC